MFVVKWEPRTFVSDHSPEMRDRKIAVRPYKCVSIHSRVCLCEDVTYIGLGVKQRERQHREKRESENPLFVLFGNNHRAVLVPTVSARWCPSPMCHVFETGRREEDQEWHVEQGSTA